MFKSARLLATCAAALLFGIAPKISGAQTNCANPNSITNADLPYVAQHATCNLGNNYDSNDPGNCNGNSQQDGEEYVFEFTPTIDICVDISVSYTGSSVSIFTFVGCPDDPASQCLEYSTSGNPRVVSGITLESGETYYFMMSNSSGCNLFNITIQEANNTAGANCCNPVFVTNNDFPYNASHSTCGLGDDYDQNDIGMIGCASGSDCSYANDEDMVFRYDAQVSGAITIEMLDGISQAGADPGIYLLDGCPDDPDSQVLTYNFFNNSSSGTNGTSLSFMIPQAGVYYILVGTKGTGVCTDFDLEITGPAPPNIGYDYRSGAYALNDLSDWCSNLAEFSTAGATPDELAGSCWFSGPSFNRWFTFEAISSTIVVSLRTGGDEGTLRYPYMVLIDENGVEIDCAEYTGKFDDITLNASTLTPGETYYIQVDNYADSLNTPNNVGTFTLCITDQTDYDDWNSAWPIPDVTNGWCSQNAEFTTVGASGDLNGGSCWYTGPSFNRWFRFQASTTFAKVDLKIGGAEGTLKWPYMTLRDNNLNELNCAVYYASQTDLTIANDSLVPGEFYYIEVDNWDNSTTGGAEGTFTLCIEDTPDYDWLAGAAEITDVDNYCSSLQQFTTIGATGDRDKGTCWYTGPDYNRWFTFVPTTNMVTIELKTGGAEGTMKWPYVALWDNILKEIECQQYTGKYNDLTITSLVVPGQQYYISVDNWQGINARGTFTLCVDDGSGGGAKRGGDLFTGSPTEATADLAVFPNPSNGQVTVALSGLANDDNIDLYVVDLTGKMVYSEIITPVDGSAQRFLNLENLSAGTYFVKLQGKTGSEVRKLILY